MHYRTPCFEVHAMSKFVKQWGNRERKSRSSQGPLKPVLEKASIVIQMNIANLGNIQSRLEARNGKLFNMVVANVHKGDLKRAGVIANELVEVRKISRTVAQFKIALEQIALRVATVKEFGDFVSELAPAVVAIREIQPELASVVPEASSTVDELSGVLSSMLIDVGQQEGMNLDFTRASSEAEKILEDASVVAEKDLKNKFPEIPLEVTRLSSPEEASLT